MAEFRESVENERQGAPVSAEVKGTSGTDYHSYVTSTENGRLRHRGGGPGRCGAGFSSRGSGGRNTLKGRTRDTGSRWNWMKVTRSRGADT